jgi:hypothetical protein
VIGIGQRSTGPLPPSTDSGAAHLSSGGSIVTKAAAILGEEVQSFAARGVTEISTLLGGTSPTPQPPVEELRQQARALVDTIVRVLGHRPDGIARLFSEAAGSRGPDGVNTASIHCLQPPRPVQAGDVAHLSLQLVNDDTEKDECVLVASDLIGASGRRIPASHVAISPNSAAIPGGGSTSVQIEVRVPSGMAPGCYTGVLQADDGESLRALVHVVVG